MKRKVEEQRRCGLKRNNDDDSYLCDNFRFKSLFERFNEFETSN